MKKIFVGLLTLGAALVVIPMFAAFEAHVINVTATIENALELRTTDLAFGTVFPEEELNLPLTLALSRSFTDQQRLDDVQYVIRQKPKCSDGESFGRVTEGVDAGGNPIYVCANAGFEILPLLCPFLSKHPDRTPVDNDGSLDAFHGPIANWTPGDTVTHQVAGVLQQSVGDLVDEWNIDLAVPCFEGSCAQDDFIPSDYQLNPDLEHDLFGCDLWVETTGFSDFPS